MMPNNWYKQQKQRKAYLEEIAQLENEVRFLRQLLQMVGVEAAALTEETKTFRAILTEAVGDDSGGNNNA